MSAHILRKKYRLRKCPSNCKDHLFELQRVADQQNQSDQEANSEDEDNSIPEHVQASFCRKRYMGNTNQLPKPGIFRINNKQAHKYPYFFGQFQQKCRQNMQAMRNKFDARLQYANQMDDDLIQNNYTRVKFRNRFPENMRYCNVCNIQFLQKKWCKQNYLRHITSQRHISSINKSKGQEYIKQIAKQYRSATGSRRSLHRNEQQDQIKIRRKSKRLMIMKAKKVEQIGKIIKQNKRIKKNRDRNSIKTKRNRDEKINRRGNINRQE